jgi:hypothetical protein
MMEDRIQGSGIRRLLTTTCPPNKFSGRREYTNHTKIKVKEAGIQESEFRIRKRNNHERNERQGKRNE